MAQLTNLLTGDDPDQYVTTLRKLSVYGLPKGVYVETGEQVTVWWRLDWEGRSWGVKDLTPIIDRVKATWEKDDERREEENGYHGTMGIDTAQGDWEVKVEVAKNLVFPLQLLPVNVEVHLQDRQVVVEF